MKTCQLCKRQYEPSRRTSKYCSGRCRVAAHRKRAKGQWGKGKFIPSGHTLRKDLENAVAKVNMCHLRGTVPTILRDIADQIEGEEAAGRDQEKDQRFARPIQKAERCGASGFHGLEITDVLIRGTNGLLILRRCATSWSAAVTWHIVHAPTSGSLGRFKRRKDAVRVALEVYGRLTPEQWAGPHAGAKLSKATWEWLRSYWD